MVQNFGDCDFVVLVVSVINNVYKLTIVLYD